MTAAHRAPLALLLLLIACGAEEEKAIFVPNTDTDRPTDRDTGAGSADTSIDSSTDPVDTTGDDTGSGADTDLVDSGSGDTGADTDLADTTPDTVADTRPMQPWDPLRKTAFGPHPAVDRRSGRDRRRLDKGPPRGYERRQGIEPRHPDVHELDITPSQWDSLSS